MIDWPERVLLPRGISQIDVAVLPLSVMGVKYQDLPCSWWFKIDQEEMNYQATRWGKVCRYCKLYFQSVRCEVSGWVSFETVFSHFKIGVSWLLLILLKVIERQDFKHTDRQCFETRAVWTRFLAGISSRILSMTSSGRHSIDVILLILHNSRISQDQ